MKIINKNFYIGLEVLYDCIFHSVHISPITSTLPFLDLPISINFTGQFH